MTWAQAARVCDKIRRKNKIFQKIVKIKYELYKYNINTIQTIDKNELTQKKVE